MKSSLKLWVELVKIMDVFEDYRIFLILLKEGAFRSSCPACLREADMLHSTGEPWRLDVSVAEESGHSILSRHLL